MTRLQPGDPITVFVRWAVPSTRTLIHARIEKTTPVSFIWDEATGPRSGGMDYRHEGHRWIRGHFPEDSPEVAALIVANAFAL